MAVAALAAFAMPSSALASKMTATHPTGTIAPVGTKVVGTNTDILSTLTNAAGDVRVQCTSVFMTGTLVKNNHEAIEGTIEKAEFKGKPGVTPHTVHCESVFGDVTVTTAVATNGLPWCLRSTAAMPADEVQVRGNSCAGAARPIRFTLDSALGSCTYERPTAEPIKGTITTHPAEPVIHIEKERFPIKEGGFFCPSEGFLDMTMDLFAETNGVHVGNPLWIDKVA